LAQQGIHTAFRIGQIRGRRRDAAFWGVQTVIKSILAVSEGGPDAQMAYRLAGELGATYGAAIEAVHYPTSIRNVAAGMIDGLSGTVVGWDQRNIEARAEASAAAFAAELASKPNTTYVFVDRQDPDDLLTRARTTDLMVAGRPGMDPDNESPESVSVALHESACPVIVAPPSGSLGALGEAVIAWNGSQQAARAVRFALPLLKNARSVTIVVVGASEKPVATGRIKGWLGHHGIAAELASIDPGAASARARGRAVLGFTHDRGASLLVMGAYGQAGVMEFLGLGGATAKIISGCRVPVLLAH